MKGKYITTSLMLAVLAGGKGAGVINVKETRASTNGHQLIWSKTFAAAKQQHLNTAAPDELKMA